MSWLSAIGAVNTNSYEREARRVTPNFFANPGQIPPVGTATTGASGTYGQYDRAAEHGYAGAQYRDGVLIGEKLNFEC